MHCVVFINYCCSDWSKIFISFPDIKHANAKLTSINAPKNVKIKTEGKLVKLYAVEVKLVIQNEILGFLESRADHQEVLSLSKIVDTLQTIVETGSIEKFKKYTPISFRNLGEVQLAFQNFVQRLNLFGQYLSQVYYLKKKKMLLGDIGYL